MSTSLNPDVPTATHLWFERGRLTVHLRDGREISCPLSFFPRLGHATTEDLTDWELTGGGSGIHWPRLDEDLSIQGLLEGRRAPAPGSGDKAYAPLLQAARRKAGLTQKALADRMGKSQTLISLAERGIIRIGQPYVQESLKACGLPPGWKAKA